MELSNNGTKADCVSDASLFYQRLKKKKVNLLDVTDARIG
jgi:hypothetical protein